MKIHDSSPGAPWRTMLEDDERAWVAKIDAKIQALLAQVKELRTKRRGLMHVAAKRLERR